MDFTRGFGLDGKIALVTGASRGIGEAIARAFAANGVTVVLASRKPEGLEKVKDSLISAGGSAIAVACNTGKPDQVAALFDRIVDEYGRLDILVNNAATNPFAGLAVDVPEWAFDKTVAVNMKGYFLASQRAARMMIDRGSGVIINIASVAGLEALPMQTVYSMTKAAVLAMTRGLARELGPHGIRVNAIAPGVVKTRFSKFLTETPEIGQPLLEATALKRFAEPAEIAGAALFLASDMSSYTTGTVIICDGGALA
ncbi:MAG: glucose 1-dehydrogenase [Acidobacteria bacterium]|nr:glucose 1-dehydrogenase [Acidobacteriota bacterium]